MFGIIDPSIIGGAVALGVFAGILSLLFLGRWSGNRAIASGVKPSHNLGSLEAAVFALLGLMIAFTFSGALSRFDIRRAQAVDEANAIGTAYLRIDLLPASAQPQLREALRQYVDARIATYRSLPNIDAANREMSRSRQLQDEIWAEATAAVRLQEARPQSEMLLLPAINQMFDLATARLAATLFHPPLIVYVMLIGLAFASALLSGYQSADGTGYDWMHKIGFAFMVAFTVYVTLDIEYPRLGFVRLDAIDQLLVDARAAMK
jgi:hypothetical protein